MNRQAQRYVTEHKVDVYEMSAFALKHIDKKVDKHCDAEYDTVDAERGEAVTLDETHKELNGKERNDEGNNDTESEQQPLKAGERAAVKEKLYGAESGCSEHNRDSHKERKLGCRRT